MHSGAAAGTSESETVLLVMLGGITFTEVGLLLVQRSHAVGGGAWAAFE